MFGENTISVPMHYYIVVCIAPTSCSATFDGAEVCKMVLHVVNLKECTRLRV